MKTTGAIFADILEEAGIDHVYGLPGGAMPILLDALADRKSTIRTVLARHEGGAACMADMHGRVTGKPGVLVGQGLWIATSGGYGIVESFLGGVPMVIVTDISDYNSLPQFGPYQDASGDYGAVDLVSMMRAMTKYTTFVSNATEFAHGLQLAIKHAVTGRPGPACVVIKFDVSYAVCEPEAANPPLRPLAGLLATSPPCISAANAARIADMLIGAKDPVIIAGTGIHRGRAHAELQALAELLGIPVATSYMGKSAIPETHDLALGTMGAVGQKAANEKITSADVLLVVGSCLAPENTKMLAPDFIRPVAQKIIQIDIEPRNAGWTYPIEIGVTSDARLALIEIANAVKSKRVKYDVKKRVADILKFKTEMKYFDEEVRRSEDIPLAPERVVHEFNKAATAEDLVVLDGGNNRIWVTHHFKSLGAGQVFAPGGAAGVGYAPPASVAAGILNPGKKVFCFSGDGGLMMQLYSLEMARQYNVPVTFMVLNNSCLGNVMDYQAHERRVMTQYPTSNFAAIAKGVGIDGVRIEKPGEIAPAIAKARANEGPMLLEFIVQDCPHFRCMG